MINNYIWKGTSCQATDKNGSPLWNEHTLYRKGETFYCGRIVTNKRFSNYKYSIDIYLSPNLRWQGGESDIDVAKFKAIVKAEELYKQFKK
jgi:hypothetical protein